MKSFHCSVTAEWTANFLVRAQTLCGIDQTSLISSHIYSRSPLFLSVLIFHTLPWLSLFGTERSPVQKKSSELKETAGTNMAMNIE